MLIENLGTVLRKLPHLTLLPWNSQVFDFANKYRGAYSDSLRSGVCPFYFSYSGYEVLLNIMSYFELIPSLPDEAGRFMTDLILVSSQDELLWGAAWLHKATRSPTYLNYIQSKG